MIRISHLETDVTRACQCSCVACNHHVPLWRAHGAHFANAETIGRDLSFLSSFLHAGRWGALGGEPLIHPNLPAILRAAKGSGIADEIEVWTNGMLLRKMGDNFWASFDILVLSVYEGKITDDDVRWVSGKCADTGVRLEVKDERAMRNFKTLLEPTPTDEAATRAKFAGCFFRHFSRVVNEGVFYTCCCAPHMPFLVQGKPIGTDGIALEGLNEEKLSAYLSRTEPLGCCNVCAGRDTAVSIPWSEERNPEKWKLASAGITGSGI